MLPLAGLLLWEILHRPQRRLQPLQRWTASGLRLMPQPQRSRSRQLLPHQMSDGRHSTPLLHSRRQLQLLLAMTGYPITAPQPAKPTQNPSPRPLPQAAMSSPLHLPPATTGHPLPSFQPAKPTQNLSPRPLPQAARSSPLISLPCQSSLPSLPTVLPRLRYLPTAPPRPGSPSTVLHQVAFRGNTIPLLQ